MTGQPAREVVEAMIDLFNDHQIDAVYALVDDHYRQFANGQFVSEGLAAARAADAWLYESLPDYRRTTSALIAQGEQVMVEWRLLGTTASGSAVDAALASWIHVVDGKITEAHIYGDLPAIRARLAG